ncbi:MAG: class I SAM-dependent methyltransferase [Solirubrobacteraceae bacterium]
MSEPAAAGRAGAAQCAWCGAHASPTGTALATCPVCRAATTYPAPSQAELERAYSAYRPVGGRFAGGGDRLLAFSRGTLARRLDRIAPPGPVLDVGSGDGSLLRALRARGREAVGLERTPGHDGALDQEIDGFDDRPGEWAAVVFWHSLEHLPDPAAALDRAVTLLRPAGVVVIAVPNLSSWQARCFGDRWLHLDLPRHLVHLPASALEAGLRERRLKLERVSHWRGGQILFGWLHGMVGELPGHPHLYSAIRRHEAQETPSVGARRLAVLLAAGVMVPAAGLPAIAEIAFRAGGTVYVEARRR